MRTCHNNQKTWHSLSGQLTDTFIFPCILNAFQWLTDGRDPLIERHLCQKDLPNRPDNLARSHLQVLVCGSVLLVGAVFRALGPDVAPVDKKI